MREESGIERLIATLDKASESVMCMSKKDTETLRSVNLFRWICSMVTLSGSSLSKSQVGETIDGNIVREATLEEVRYINACMELYAEFENMLSMSIKLDEKHIKRINSILCGKETKEYRRGNPYIKHMGYKPPYSSDVAGQMDEAVRTVTRMENRTNRVLHAVFVHDIIIKIWPFDEKNSQTAYAAMSYQLLRGGYPLPVLNVTEKEHLKMCAASLREGNSRELAAEIIKSLIEQCG